MFIGGKRHEWNDVDCNVEQWRRTFKHFVMIQAFVAVTSEASSSMRAIDWALVSVIIAMFNDSERLLNKKWLQPVTNQSNAPIGGKAKRNTFLPSV